MILWNGIGGADNPIEQFHAFLTNAFNKAFPVQNLKVKNKKPWITCGIKISSKNLRSLHTIRKYHSNNQFFVAYFNRYKRTYRKVIGAAKEFYYKGKIEGAKNKTKKNWEIVNQLRGKANVLQSNIEINPNILNNFYCTIGDKLSSNLNSKRDPMDYLAYINVPEIFVFESTNVAELKRTFIQIKNKNSSGYDGISVRIFDCLPESALQALAGAINQSFVVGEFPMCLKSAVVVPLFKGGDMIDPSNFRPISLLPTLSKVIEKIVKKRLMLFLGNNEILNPFQFGFLSGKNTDDAIFSLLNEVYLNINGGEAVAAIFCDFSKAFDCVDHRILLLKLRRYGFGEITLKWFSTYLEGRMQMVRADGEYSDKSLINRGVPQGSVLGPILFLLYLNDLAALKIQGAFTFFADDTSLLWHGKNKDDLKMIVDRDLREVKFWCDANLLCFNINKTSIITFGFCFNDLYLDNEIVENKTLSKFLGLTIDNKLKFEEHIKALSKKLSAGCYAIRIVSNELSCSTTKMVYYALFESHVRYGIAFWGYTNKQLFNSIFVLQKRAVRYLCRAVGREHCQPLFIREKILTAPCLFILETVCLMHKKYFGLETRDNIYNTRLNVNSNINLPIPKSTLTKQSIFYESKKMYNHLNNDLKSTENYRLFRRGVKNILLQRAYYSLEEYYSDIL